MKSAAVDIPGPAGRLEGSIDTVGTPAMAVAVVCHPHPLHQGTMQNKVVTTVARAFAHLGASVIRFNFRGVGASVGSYADGVGEREDALAVIEWVRARYPAAPLFLAGFSFGGAVALAVASRVAPRGLVTVAPPVSWLPSDFVAPACPWLLVHGAADEVVPAAPVVEWCEALESPPKIELLDDVGHFFHGSLATLEGAVTRFFAADFAVGSA